MPITRLLAIALLLTAGCAHDRRMAEITAFEAGYFQLLTASAYRDAYGLLHSEVRERSTEKEYETFFTVLTDTLGPMTGWKKVPGAHDQSIPLLERERRRDPLPPDNPKSALQSRYLVSFGKGSGTFLVTTGWEGGRMVLRGQALCCMDQKTVAALRARAEELGVASLFDAKADAGKKLDRPGQIR